MSGSTPNDDPRAPHIPGNCCYSCYSCLSPQDKSLLEAGLQGVVALVLEEWGTSTPTTVIVVTDGSMGYGPQSLDFLVTASQHPAPPSKCSTPTSPTPILTLAPQSSGGPSELRLPLPFPCSISVVALADRWGGERSRKASRSRSISRSRSGISILVVSVI